MPEKVLFGVETFVFCVIDLDNKKLGMECEIGAGYHFGDLSEGKGVVLG